MLRFEFSGHMDWRIRNPEAKQFTWRQKNLLIPRRLDSWLISNACQEDGG